MTRPFAWERSYPPGLRWDAPIATTTLTALMRTAVAKHGDKPFIEFRGQRTSFRSFGEQVERAAAGFQSLGVGPGVSVALYLPNVPYHPISFFGVLLAGGRIVHLSPLDPPRSLARNLVDSGARTLVAGQQAGAPGDEAGGEQHGEAVAVLAQIDDVQGVGVLAKPRRVELHVAEEVGGAHRTLAVAEQDRRRRAVEQRLLQAHGGGWGRSFNGCGSPRRAGRGCAGWRRSLRCGHRRT